MQHHKLDLLDFVDAMCRSTLKVASALPPCLSSPLPPSPSLPPLSLHFPSSLARACSLSLSLSLTLSWCVSARATVRRLV
jgi:hypothetical protein